MKKVLIMGCPGAGKARLAARLGRITGLDVYHIKDDRFSESHTEDQKKAWRDAVAGIVSNDSWIIEGTQSITYEMRVEAADTVFFIRQKPMNCLKNFIKRALERKRGHREHRIGMKRDMLKKIIAYRKTLKPMVDDLLEKNKDHLDVIFFTTEEEIDQYLEKLRAEYKAAE